MLYIRLSDWFAYYMHMLGFHCTCPIPLGYPRHSGVTLPGRSIEPLYLSVALWVPRCREQAGHIQDFANTWKVLEGQLRPIVWICNFVGPNERIRLFTSAFAIILAAKSLRKTIFTKLDNRSVVNSRCMFPLLVVSDGLSMHTSASSKVVVAWKSCVPLLLFRSVKLFLAQLTQSQMIV